MGAPFAQRLTPLGLFSTQIFFSDIHGRAFMANQLNLEEQEQLDQVRHFWARYGNLITWVLIVVLGAVAAWNGWNYWQRKQAVDAAALFDEIDRAALAKDAERMERALAEMKSRFASTTLAAQSGLIAGKTLFEAGKPEAARAALTWVMDKASDDAYQAIARLRLVGLDMEAKAYDQALKTLDAPVPKAFAPLVADRRGDIFMAQGKPDEAKAQYQQAWQGLGERADYRRLVEVKLAALGVVVGDTSTSTEVAR